MAGAGAGAMLHPAQARPSANAAIPAPRSIASASSIRESRLARSGLSARGAEYEALRILVQGVEHPVERARVAVELLDQRVETRQGLIAERARGVAHLLQARRHPVEGQRALLQLARERTEVREGAARVSHQQREILGAGPQMLRQLAYRRNHVQARVKNRRAQADARGLPARGLEQLARGTIVVQGHVSKPGDALVAELRVGALADGRALLNSDA